MRSKHSKLTLRRSSGIGLGLICLAMLSVAPAAAQLMTQLKAQTVSEFESYLHNIEQKLNAEWESPNGFLAVDSRPDVRKRVLAGEVIAVPGVADGVLAIDDGMVHDWIGDVFIPNATPEQVIKVLRNFDDHHRFYPDVIKSRTVKSNGAHVTGYWRLKKKSGALGAVLDVIDEADYEQVAVGRWTCRSYAKNISEVKDPDSRDEVKLKPGQDQGYLWRLAGFWGVEAVPGGSLAECRTISLSRSIPFGLGFVVKPFLRDVPVESMLSSLRGTRTAVLQ